MADRSAVSTILGYFYQFDRSILSILGLAGDADEVAIECIEDIDIRTATETTAVQCKYYEKSEYNHSVIKPAVMFMLAHFKEGLTAGRPPISYQLSGHFSGGQDKLVLPFDIEFLKTNFLTVTSKKDVTTRKHEELGVTDAELEQFRQVLTIDVNAEKFDDQLDKIKRMLGSHFSCSPFMAEFFYYNSSLRVIKELSIESDATRRVISKKDFLAKIDTSSVIFDEWFVEKRGKSKYLAELRSTYFGSTINVSPADRLFLIHIAAGTYDSSAAKVLLKAISRKYAKLSKRESKPCSPYVLMLGPSEGELTALKQELHEESFDFVDGYDFRGAQFDTKSISRPAIAGNGPVLRIFGDLTEAQDTFLSFKRAREIYEFYVTDPAAGFADSAIRYTTFQIPDYKDIDRII